MFWDLVWEAWGLGTVLTTGQQLFIDIMSICKVAQVKVRQAHLNRDSSIAFQSTNLKPQTAGPMSIAELIVMDPSRSKRGYEG